MDTLLEQLDFPRETPAALHAARVALEEALRAAGFTPWVHEFVSHVGRGEVAGFLCLAAGLALALALAIAPRRRVLGCAAMALVALALVTQAGGLDAALAARTQANLAVTIEPRGAVARHVVLSAHYDSKTEWLDHVERGALVAMLGVVTLAGCLAAAGRRRRAVGACAAAIAVGLGLCGAHLASPLWLRARSPGAADDAAACALLVDLARDLAERPLERTRLTVVWFAAEEIGAQGSRAWVSQARERPDAALNLECLGAGPRLGLATREWTGAGIAGIPVALDRSLRVASAGSLARVPWPVVTDAGSWRRAEVPAATLVGLPAEGFGPRGLHAASDARAALDRQGLEAAARFLRRWLATQDAPDGVLPAP